jgi:hypothetical protein
MIYLSWRLVFQGLVFRQSGKLFNGKLMACNVLEILLRYVENRRVKWLEKEGNSHDEHSSPDYESPIKFEDG